MNNKKIIALAAAFALTLQAGFATNISGVSGNNGIFDINPTSAKGSTGFRHYQNFYLSEGDIANLILKYGNKNLGTFVNLVDGKVNIQGIVNTTRNGKFAPGHAVFISPNGMVVGASGVLNVGSLSVYTPSESNYNKMVNDPSKIQYSNTSKDANAEILVKGKVLSRGSVNLQGSNVVMSEGSAIVNGLKYDKMITARSQADQLFNEIVNAGDAAADKYFANENGKIVIRANGKDGMVNVRGDILNANNGNIVLVNEQGKGGIKVTGDIINRNGNMTLDNKAGQTLIKGSLENNNGTLIISDNGKGIHINSGAKVSVNDGNLKVENNGKNGTAVYGDVAVKNGELSIENNKGRLYIAGDIAQKGNKTFQIINDDANSSTMIAKTSDISSDGNVYVRNASKGGLFVNGTVKAGKNVTLDNRAGVLTVNNNITSKGGNISLANTGSKLAVSSKSTISTNGKGNVVIKNTGKDGLHMYGTVKAENGVTSIKSTDGKMVINGSVNSKAGNIGIVNEGKSLRVTENAVINNESGKTNIINTGEGGMKEYGTINVNEQLEIINDNGQMYVDGTINGNNAVVNILSRRDSKGVYIKPNADIKAGELTIKDTSVAGGSGVIMKGSVASKHDVNIKSSNNNIYVNGKAQAGNNIYILGTAENGKITLTKSADFKYGNSMTTSPKNGTVVTDLSRKQKIEYPGDVDIEVEVSGTDLYPDKEVYETKVDEAIDDSVAFAK